MLRIGRKRSLLCCRFLIVCPLVFVAGLVDAIAGGGGLISLPAYLLSGVPAHVAIATNKLSSATGTAVSTGRFLKHGYIPAKLSLCAAAMALLGSTIGANISMLLSESILRGMLLVVLPIVAFYVFKNKNMGENQETGTRTERQLALIAMGAALIVGMYDGLYGPGTGTFLILILTGLGRMELKSAAGTTKVINLASNLAALVTFICHGQVYWALGAHGLCIFDCGALRRCRTGGEGRKTCGSASGADGAGDSLCQGCG